MTSLMDVDDLPLPSWGKKIFPPEAGPHSDTFPTCMHHEQILLISNKPTIMKNQFLACVFAFLVQGAPDGDRVSVSVMEGDSVTLHTNTTNPQEDRIIWFFNGTRIAQINRDQSKICKDVQCKEVTGRFRDRLKLDNQTGSLTIMNTRTEDSGVYQQSMKINSDTFFSVSVHGVPAAERDQMRRKSVEEGESVSLDPGEIKTNGVMWHFNDVPIAEITGYQSKICTDVQCDEGNGRFRDRLKLDHQTGSLTITNIRNTHSGEYTLEIISDRFTIVKIFSVAVTDSGSSSGGVIGIAVAVLLLAAAAGVIYYCCRSSRKGQCPVSDLRGPQHIRDNLPQQEKPLMGKLACVFEL